MCRNVYFRSRKRRPSSNNDSERMYSGWGERVLCGREGCRTNERGDCMDECAAALVLMSLSCSPHSPHNPPPLHCQYNYGITLIFLFTFEMRVSEIGRNAFFFAISRHYLSYLICQIETACTIYSSRNKCDRFLGESWRRRGRHGSRFTGSRRHVEQQQQQRGFLAKRHPQSSPQRGGCTDRESPVPGDVAPLAQSTALPL